MLRRRAVRLAAMVCVGLATATAAGAQRGGGYFNSRTQVARVDYNGRFTFTRLRYNGNGRGWGSNAWNHDYPQADLHLPKILESLTAIEPNLEVSNILDLEDPEIFKNPILYMWEPGGWRITDEGAKNLRDFMLKGGFVVFDDFEADQWYNFESQFLRALPEAQFIELDPSQRLFHAFFEIREVPQIPSINFYFGSGGQTSERGSDSREPHARAILDGHGHIMVLSTHNTDIGDAWEREGDNREYFDRFATPGYAFGINVFIYAMTH